MGFGNDDDAQGVNETQRKRRRQYRGLSPPPSAPVEMTTVAGSSKWNQRRV